MTINYQLEIYTDWHCGAGVNAGAEADATVIKDQNGLPYIPGKTIKGLLKNALLEITEVQKEPQKQAYQTAIDTIFGKMIEGRNSEPGKAFFSNAILPDAEQAEIITNELAPMLYRTITSTAIKSETGLATQGSLRTMEVCMPLTLEGTIKNVETTHESFIQQAFQWTRHFGVNRNRGLGRCRFSS